MAEDDESDGVTRGTAKRYWLTNDGIAWVLTLSMITVVAAAGSGHLTLDRVPDPILLSYVAAFGTAIAWAFGKDAVEAWKGGKK